MLGLKPGALSFSCRGNDLIQRVCQFGRRDASVDDFVRCRQSAAVWWMEMISFINMIPVWDNPSES